MAIESRKTHLTRFYDRNGISSPARIEEEKRSTDFFEILSTYHQLLAEYPEHRGVLDRFYRKGPPSFDFPENLASRVNAVSRRFQTFQTQLSKTSNRTEEEINLWLAQQEAAMVTMQVQATIGTILVTHNKLKKLYEEWGCLESIEDIENEYHNETVALQQPGSENVNPDAQSRLTEVNAEIDALEEVYSLHYRKLTTLVSHQEMQAIVQHYHFPSP